MLKIVLLMRLLPLRGKSLNYAGLVCHGSEIVWGERFVVCGWGRFGVEGFYWFEELMFNTQCSIFNVQCGVVSGVG